MENSRNLINMKLVSNEKDYLKWMLNPSYILLNIFEKHLVTICKNKVTSKLNKPAYLGIK